MCSHNSATNAATQAEKDRQAQSAAQAAQINALFDSPERGKQITDYGTALRSMLTGEVNRQQVNAQRGQKFALARGGLTGGSAAVDAGKTLGEDYTRGLLKAEQGVQQGVASLRSADEGSRSDLLALATSGNSTGVDASRTGSVLASNLAKQRAAIAPESLGDIFSTTGALYKAQQDAAEKRKYQLLPVGSLYSSSPW